MLTSLERVDNLKKGTETVFNLCSNLRRRNILTLLIINIKELQLCLK